MKGRTALSPRDGLVKPHPELEADTDRLHCDARATEAAARNPIPGPPHLIDAALILGTSTPSRSASGFVLDYDMHLSQPDQGFCKRFGETPRHHHCRVRVAIKMSLCGSTVERQERGKRRKKPEIGRKCCRDICLSVHAVLAFSTTKALQN